MFRELHVLRLAAAFSTVLLLSACETSEERAEGHYQAALELINSGDLDRGVVELRNVFDLNGQHKDARMLYATTQRTRGKTSDAYGNFLLLVEQYPDFAEARRILAEMAAEQLNWDEAERHTPAALEMMPEDPVLQSIDLLLRYRGKLTNEEDTGDELAEAEQVLAERPDDLFAARVSIDGFQRKRSFDELLEVSNTMLEYHPDKLEFHQAKLLALSALSLNQEVGLHLEAMVNRFPENEAIRTNVIRWYMQNQELDRAEDFLRQLADQATKPRNKRDALATVVQFLEQTKGRDAARSEAQALIAEGKFPTYFKRIKAIYDFAEGEQRQAITDLNALVEEAEPNQQINNARIALARMLVETGDAVSARAQVEQVLSFDAGHVEALQMRSHWLIDDDRAGEAIQTLRRALDQDPRNSDTLTLMARAHMREGNRTLAGERLGLAVEVANNAPPESLRYAAFLVEDDKSDVAERILIEALRRASNNVDILRELGAIYLSQSDWPRTEDVVARLKQLGQSELSTALRSQMLLLQNNMDDGIELLRNLAESESASGSAVAVVIQTYLQARRFDEANAFIDEKLAEDPNNPQLQFLRANLSMILQDFESAETVLRNLVEQYPQAVNPTQSLYLLLQRTNRASEAEEVLNTALTATPSPHRRLMWLKATDLERNGDIDGAIEIYEQMYEANSDDLIVANNLASLLSTYRSSEENIDKAFVIARRLRSSDVPDFQETYGWIEYLRGNIEEALKFLEPAAEVLVDDANTHMHLGLAYASMERFEEARNALTKALELVGEPLPDHFQKAKDKLNSLPALQD